MWLDRLAAVLVWKGSPVRGREGKRGMTTNGMEDIYLGDKGGRGRKVRRKKEFQSVQLCPTPWDSVDCSLPGSCVHGFLQARILEWVAMPCSRGSSPPRDSTHVFCITARLFIHWATWEAPYRKTKMPKLTPYFSGLFPAKGFHLYIPKWTQFSFSNLISISLVLSALFFFFFSLSPLPHYKFTVRWLSFFSKAASPETHSGSDGLMSSAAIPHLLFFLTLQTLSSARDLTPCFSKQEGGAQKTVITLHIVLQLFS